MASTNAPGPPSRKGTDPEKPMISPAATSTVLSGPNPGERLASYFDNFFRAIGGISTLGASITFSKIVQTPVTPWIDYGIGADAVQFYLSISWMLFLLALVVTSSLASLLSLYRPQAIDAFATKVHKYKKRVMWAATFTSLVLILLVFASFLFISLVVVAYAGPVGWITLAATLFFGILAILGIIWQSPLQWPQWVLPKPKGDPTRIASFHPSTTSPPSTLPSFASYGSDPFLRHVRLHGSLRRQRSFNDLHDPSDDKDLQTYVEKAERVEKGGAAGDGGTRVGGRYLDDGYAYRRDPPPPRREFRHDRRQRYSGGDHYTQYNPENRNSGASTLVPGAYDGSNNRWSNTSTIPPARYGAPRPFAQTAFGLD